MNDKIQRYKARRQEKENIDAGTSGDTALSRSLPHLKKTDPRGVLGESNISHRLNTCNKYKHVKAKIDSGLRRTKVPSRPPEGEEVLRGEPQVKGNLKEKSKFNDYKEVAGCLLQPTTSKNVTGLFVKKTSKGKNVLIPILRDSMNSREHLKIILYGSEVEEILVPALPNGIKDIDDEVHNPSTYVKDIYKYLTDLEVKYAIRPDHLKDQIQITCDKRTSLVNWLVVIQMQFYLQVETFHLTVAIIDSYLQAVPDIQCSLILIGITAMFIASKYEETYALTVQDIVSVLHNDFTKQDVLQCEREILFKIGFSLARPIPINFLNRFVKAAGVNDEESYLASYFIDLSLLDYSTAHYRSSKRAAAALCLSIHVHSNSELTSIWTPTMEYYSTYSLIDIVPIIRKIANIAVNIKRSKAIEMKYLSENTKMVEKLQGAPIKKLAELV